MVELFVFAILSVIVGCALYDKWVKPVWMGWKVSLNTKAPQNRSEIEN
jgi:hypothetical protein